MNGSIDDALISGGHPRTQTPVVAVSDLRVSVRTPEAVLDLVRGVSFDIMPGEILGVVGESGAGKSMIGAALMGLVDAPLAFGGGVMRHDGRMIALGGEDHVALRGASIAMIFQDPLTSLNPVFSIGRQLVETIETHTELRGAAARAEAAALLARVGIPAAETRLDHYPHEFSGGMRQRVVIALALAGRPRLIVADEPTTALDVSIQGQIIELLRDLARERGTAVLLITHDMGVIASLADRVAVLYAGRIIEIGPVAEVIRRPLHPYTQGLMLAIPEIGRKRRRLVQIKGAMPHPGRVPAGCAYQPRCPRAIDACAGGVPPLVGASGHQAACLRPGAQDAVA